jgi:hypothetical protein
VTVEPSHQTLENPFGVTSDQGYRAALVVASTSTDATDCAMSLATIGLRAAARLAPDDHAV